MKKGCLGLFIGFVALLLLLFLVLFVGSYFNGHIGVAHDVSTSALLSNPPPILKKPVTLKIVTFNIQLLWVVGQNRAERARAVAATLAQLDPDIVGFQEAFDADDRAVLIEGLQTTRLKHQQYYPSGTVGSGLLIASVFPIRETYFHRYVSSGEWFKAWEGDWWAGKGAALARVELPDGAGFVDFYDTHAQARYGSRHYDVVGQRQMVEFAEFIRGSHVRTVPAFAVGDFNARPGSPALQAIVEGTPLTRLMSIDTRIDHIFGVTDAVYTMEVLETIEIRDGAAPGGKPIRLSDHNGYMSTIRITPSGSSAGKAAAPAL